MKKTLLFSIFTACAVTALAKAPVSITGEWDRRNDGAVKVFRIDHGRLEEVCSYQLNGGKSFAFLFYPTYEGWYMLGTGTGLTLQDKYRFYFREGDGLNLRVNDSTYVLQGKNSKENIELAKWHDMVLPLERKSVYFMKTRSVFNDFFPELEAMKPRLQQYKPGKTGNMQFDNMFRLSRFYDMAYYAAEFVSTPRTAHPSKEDYTEFYKNLRLSDFTKDAGLLQYPLGTRLLSNLTRIENSVKGADNPSFDERMKLPLNDTLLGEMVIQQASFLKTHLGFLDIQKKYGKYIITEDQKNRMAATGIKLAQADSKPGQAAINFTYPDLQGKNVSLTDFKGKVVLVDVWATWCGPCKAEIPALKKLEEEMRDKDIVFMSVSVDEAKDHQKWKDFVAKENLKGVQLFASGWSDIAKYYNIKGIPRFMVFDKEGNIVTTDAPRPSGTELKLLLESKLK